MWSAKYVPADSAGSTEVSTSSPPVMCVTLFRQFCWRLSAHREGGSYFVTDGRNYVFRRFFTELLATQETSAPSRSFPFRVAWTLAPVVEGAWSVLHLKNDPLLTRQMVRMIGLPFTLHIDRARQELQYEPAFQFEPGVREIKGT